MLTFNTYNKAIDKAIEYGVEEEKAIDLIGEVIDIFGLQPEDTEADMLNLLSRFMELG